MRSVAELTVAEPLVNQYGEKIPRSIAAMIVAVHPRFPARQFIASALDGYAALNLMARGRRIAEALARYLPQDFEAATGILLASLGQRPVSQPGEGGMSSFLYLPHTQFVAAYGLDHFETSMRAQYELTQRFTAEFSMRPFLEHHTAATLRRLRSWTEDRSEHVRRLVSESTRPRLPWGARLRRFQQDPRPVLALLELLKDDDSLYVRRSVANNLNDIGKDNPDQLIATLRRWKRGATGQREWLINHALRTAVKRGEAPALEILGYAGKPAAAVVDVDIRPARASIDGSVSIGFSITNTSRKSQPLLVDLCIHYVKSSGKSSPKVFKLKRLELAPGQSARLAKRVSLKQLTTRRHYPGTHRVDVLLNGRATPIGAFRLLK